MADRELAGQSPTEVMLSHPHLFGLQTITPVQRAICRVSDGWAVGELWRDRAVRAALKDALPPAGRAPRMLLDIGAIRTGKSLKASAIAVTRSQTCDISSLRAGEVHPRIPIISTSLDNSKIVFGHLAGHVLGSPILSRLVLAQTAESLTLRHPPTPEHPGGLPIEIRCVAGARAGSSLVGRWLAGVIFDEATLMLGSADGRMRDLNQDLLQLEGRMLPGAQIVLIGSTVAPPRGPVFSLLHKHWGRPSEDVAAIWSTGPEAHPELYTDEYVSALAPEVRTVCTRRVFLDPEQTWLDYQTLDRAQREGPEELEPDEAVSYVVATDPATRTNAWTVVVVGRYPVRPLFRVALAREWLPAKGEPLRVQDVMREIKAICERYSTSLVVGDRYMADTIADFAAVEGLEYLNADMKRDDYNTAYLDLKRLFDDGDLEIPPVENLRSDLQRIRRVVGARGQLAFESGSSGAGRHCDYLPALLRAIVHRPEALEIEPEDRSELDRLAEEDRVPRTDVEGAMGRLYGWH